METRKGHQISGKKDTGATCKYFEKNVEGFEQIQEVVRM